MSEPTEEEILEAQEDETIANAHAAALAEFNAEEEAMSYGSHEELHPGESCTAERCGPCSVCPSDCDQPCLGGAE